MKKYLPILMFLVLSFGSQSFASSSDHALGKTFSVVTSPVVHPKRTVKQILGSVVFATEEVVDVAHLAFHGASVATQGGEGRYFGPVYLFFEKADEYSGKADSGLESAEQYFFGTSN